MNWEAVGLSPRLQAMSVWDGVMESRGEGKKTLQIFGEFAGGKAWEKTMGEEDLSRNRGKCSRQRRPLLIQRNRAQPGAQSVTVAPVNKQLCHCVPAASDIHL